MKNYFSPQPLMILFFLFLAQSLFAQIPATKEAAKEQLKTELKAITKDARNVLMPILENDPAFQQMKKDAAELDNVPDSEIEQAVNQFNAQYDQFIKDKAAEAGVDLPALEKEVNGRIKAYEAEYEDFATEFLNRTNPLSILNHFIGGGSSYAGLVIKAKVMNHATEFKDWDHLLNKNRNLDILGVQNFAENKPDPVSFTKTYMVDPGQTYHVYFINGAFASASSWGRGKAEMDAHLWKLTVRHRKIGS